MTINDTQHSSLEPKAPAHPLKYYIVRAVGIVLFVIFILGAVKFCQVRAAIQAGAMQGPPPQTVTSAKAVITAWPNELHAVGTLAALEGASLATEEAGVVSEILYEPGELVESGAVLVKLDTTVESANLAAAKARLVKSEQDLNRSRQLRKKQAVSASDLDAAQAAYQSAQADVEAIRSLIERRTITAPFTGQAGVQLVSIGEYLEAGKPAVSLYSLSPLRLDFSVAQREVAKIKAGQVVRFTVDAFPGERFEAEVTSVDPQVDARTRNVNVQATYQNADNQIRPGMFVDLRVELGGGEDLVTVPQTAVKYAPYGDMIYVLDKKTTDAGEQLIARPVTVKLGRTRGDQVSILSGIEEGERNSNLGGIQIASGAIVMVNNEVTPANDPNPNPPNS